MGRLLIIADDFTGALDTGVQFASRGAATCVVARPDYDSSALGESCQVLSVNAESRHLPPREAYDVVFRTVRSAREAGFTHILKKTDSALRGNIGAELAAVLAAAETENIAFFPALPGMDRTTLNGIHYIDGVPVAESVFGQDPFEPVRSSSVAEIIGQQTDVPVVLHGLEGTAGEMDRPGIHVFDAVTDGDLRRAAADLKAAGKLRCMAGCSGLAAVLPELLDMDRGETSLPPMSGRLLTVCGSVNPVMKKQMDRAEQEGFLRIRMTPEQKLKKGWAYSEAGRETIAQWLRQVRSVPGAIVECGVDDTAATDTYMKALGMDLELARRQIADAMGGVLQRLLDMGLERDLLVTGGDTLQGFMRHIGQSVLIPLGEPMPGVVQSQIQYGGKTFNLLSKSGGFGSETLLLNLEAVPHREALRV